MPKASQIDLEIARETLEQLGVTYPTPEPPEPPEEQPPVLFEFSGSIAATADAFPLPSGPAFHLAFELYCFDDDRELYFQTSADGETFEGGAGTYEYFGETLDGTDTTPYASAADTKIILVEDGGVAGDAVGSGAGEGVAGHIWCSRRGELAADPVNSISGAFPTFHWDLEFRNAAGALRKSRGVGSRKTRAPILAVRLVFEGGSMNFRLGLSAR